MTQVRLSHFPNMRQVGAAGSSAVVYDDIQAGVDRLIRVGITDPTWRTWDFGLGGPAFSVLGFAVNQYVDLWIQSSHRMKLLSVLENHLHFTVPSDSVGDKIQFQIDVIAAGIGETFATVSGSPFTAEHTLIAGDSARHCYLNVADLPGVNTTVSTAYSIQLKRIAASSDEYSGECYVLFNDSHMALDTPGSLQEGSKT